MSKELVERLRTPLAREETMWQWDHWRRTMRETRSSLPRDMFENWCELQDEEERFPAATRIEALERDLAARSDVVERLTTALKHIKYEAERENGGWVHLKRCIAVQALAALDPSV